jgi:hypothetical protein
MARMKMLSHLVRPASGGAAGVVIVFALLLAIAAEGGLLGIPLAFIVTSWFFKYAYILFDHTVWGFAEPPTLDIKMLNPLDEQRPLAQLVILGLIYAAVKLAQTRLDSAAAGVIVAAAALLLPASIAILGLERNILKAVYPIALARMVRGLGPMYAVVLAVIALYVFGLELLGKLSLWLPLQIGIGMFAILSVFSALGGALYERREELGLEAWHSPERMAERAGRADLRDSDITVAEAYGQMRVGSHSNAWAVLQGWLTSRGSQLEDYRWLCDRLGAWHDPRYANRMTQEYVERLLSLKQDSEALDAVARRLREDASFRPKTAASTLRIARLATHGGGVPRVARALLADFGERYANDPSVGVAAELARHLGP